MGGILEGPEQADGERLDFLILDQLAHLRLGPLRVERDDHRAAVVDPLLDLDDRVAGDQVRQRHLGVHVVVVGARGAGDPQRVAGALGDEQAYFRAAQLGDRVGDDRRPVDQRPGAGEKVGQRHLQLARGDQFQRVDDAAAVVAVGGRLLGPVLAARLGGDDDVGEGAADVDADVEVLVGHQGLPPLWGTSTRAVQSEADGSPLPIPRRQSGATAISRVRPSGPPSAAATIM